MTVDPKARPATRRDRVAVVATLLVAVLVAGWLAWYGLASLGQVGNGPPGSGHVGSAPARPGAAGVPTTGVLADLPVAREVNVPPYKRDAFGPAWKDTDGNHCDQRDDVLARDMVNVVRAGRCTVVAGTLHDPYTGKTIQFDLRGLTGVAKQRAASLVQIDHIVPLKEAWVSGARDDKAWPPARRLAYATDRFNLRAVDGATNNDKSDQDPAKWMPPARSYWCTYLSLWDDVKARYGLTVNAGERTAIARRQEQQKCPT